ncbi:MAG: DNA gyrase subunit A [Clostridiales bacterium]|nr:DNA gyrase subunit A [Clostridiales bacterium]
MAKKPKDIQTRLEEIVQKSMEDVMHDSMLPYSEHVILERALPRAEDGLKPVQRRILFTMHELGITPDKPHRKCARIVGDCLGKYHPHGDSSVYDALVRLAQPFAMRAPLVDGHGNFGSIDGDSAAAMRYTEARMTPLATEMLRDIEKDTVDFQLNFDDTQKEPVLLPSRYPNLLVNGSSGIAVGLATNIPPHNFGEVVDGAIALMDKPDMNTQELMQYIPAPDFPTGGILAVDGELLSAYETGRGKLTLRARTHIEQGNAGRQLIVITEIPYQVNKANMLEKILKVSEEKKALFAGIHDIRDESDRTGMRAVIEVKRDADAEKILTALFKYSDLQVSFGANMVAIAGGKPVQMGLKTMLMHFITHRKQVVTRRTKYELEQARARAHILEGLIVAVDNLDEVIRLIRGSKNPKEAREKLIARFDLSEMQAQAILDMRLQRLTNLEILTLRKEYEEVCKLIERLEGILKSEKKLLRVIKDELAEMKEKYADARRTELVNAFEKIEIVQEAEPAEEVAVIYTRAGFIKRLTRKVYDKTEPAELEAETVLLTQTDKRILVFTNKGSMFNLPVSQTPECAKAKDRGLPPNGLLAGLEKDEKPVSMMVAGDFAGDLLFVSAKGTVKRAAFSEYDAKKSKIAATGLKDEDEVIGVWRINLPELLLVSQQGMSIHFMMDEIPQQGRTAGGVKGITLAEGDRVIAALQNESAGELLIFTEKGYAKRSLLVDFDLQARGGKGLRAVTFQKNGATGTYIAAARCVTVPYDFNIRQKSGMRTKFNTEMIRIEERAGKGALYAVVVMDDIVEDIEV